MHPTNPRRLPPHVVALVLILVGAWLTLPLARADKSAPIHVIAAESSYGSMVQTIGGDYVDVVSLLDSPDVNPHQFRASPKIGRQLHNADLVVMNGAGFDGWMGPLLKGTENADRTVIKASEAASAMVMSDHNWHLFYSPRIMLATASHVAQALIEQDPAHKSGYRAGLKHFREQLLPVYGEVQKIIAAHPNLTVTATVPVYNYMIQLLGYKNLFHDVQFASVRNNQPSARQVKTFIQGLKQHKVKLLIYNVQVHSRLAKNEVQTAEQAGIPTVSVSALPIHGENYAQWQVTQLKKIKKALDNAENAS